MFQIFLLLLLQTETDTVYNLRDFRLPESGALKLWIDVNADINEERELSGHWNYYGNYSVEEFSKSRSGGSGISVSFDKRNERTEFHCGGSIRVAGGAKESDFTSFREMWYFDSIFRVEDELLRASFSQSSHFDNEISLSPEIVWYPFRKILFTGIRSNVGFSYDKGTYQYFLYDSDYYGSEYQSLDTSKTTSYNAGLKISPILGIGRLRPLEYPSRALEVAEILKDHSFPVNDPVMVQRIAELYTRRWEYSIKYWHPDWEFYEDMEEIFTEFGVPIEEMSIRKWMQIIDASSIWNYYSYTSYNRYPGRPYGIRLTIEPSLNQHFAKGKREGGSIEGTYYWSIYESENQTYSFYFQPGKLVLEGGYPLTNAIHYQGKITYQPDFFYSHSDYYRYYSVRTQDTLLIMEDDTTMIEKQWETKDYSIIYSNFINVYLIYTLNLGMGFNGSIRRVFNEYESEEFLDVYDYYWHNNIYLKAGYTFRDRLRIYVKGGFDIGRSRQYYEYPHWTFRPNASLDISYRIF